MYHSLDDKLISTSGGADETGCSGDRGSPDGGWGPGLLSRRAVRRTIRRAARRTTVVLLDRGPRRSHGTRHRRRRTSGITIILHLASDDLISRFFQERRDQVRVHE